MKRRIITDFDEAKQEATHLHLHNNENYALVIVKKGIWVTKQYYANKVGAIPFWNTKGNTPRARNSARHWTPDEKQMLINEYAKNGARGIVARTGRTTESVYKMALKLNVRFKKQGRLK
jgi:hypothetical protein